MRRTILTCVFALACSCLYAQTAPGKLLLNITGGYEQQDLKWSIAGNIAGQNPNIYSELQWKGVGGVSLSANAEWNAWKRFLISAAYSNTNITSGTVTDNDYNGDNRTNMVYNELFDADKGYLRNWLVGGGYFIINKAKFQLKAFAGYNNSVQSLFILDRTGNFPDLNSTYKTNWKGPYIKASTSIALTGKLKIAAALTYNQADYSSAADWNLIQTFEHPVSYRHTAKGFGIDGNARVVYSLSKCLGVQIGGSYYSWQTGNGIDELFLSAGGSNKTQLNKVERTGCRLFAGITLNVF